MTFSSMRLSTKIMVGLIGFVFIATFILIVVSSNKTPTNQQAHYINDNASADNKVEALKTMTANLLAMQTKNKQLTTTVNQLKSDNESVMSQLKQTIQQQLQVATQKLKQQQTEHHTALISSSDASEDYPVNQTASHQLTWVNDMASVSDGNIKPPETDSPKKTKITSKPRYTISLNATLTGATLMTPIIGRIPLDGKLPSPYQFKVVVSASNLTANGYPLPGIKGAVMSGVASGDLLAHCARGDIHSITFIFNDGTISSTQSQNDDKPLGYIANDRGDPCLKGSFHSNAALFLGTTSALAGIEGYATGIADSQYMRTSTAEGNSISNLMGSANRAGLGQGIASAAQATQTWWNRRVDNSFDYVYVSNLNPVTHKPKTVSINISQQIPIDYNPRARKVSYETIKNNFQQLD